MLTPVLGRETDGSYDVVLTNPPFGERLKIRATDAKQAKYSICQHTSGGYPSDKYSDTELGLVFMERAYRLLAGGGRLGIVLPETYFFSSSYQWFRKWVSRHFDVLAVMNIPMEAFQGFCRAKTNFYVMRKKSTKGAASMKPPSWLSRVRRGSLMLRLSASTRTARRFTVSLRKARGLVRSTIRCFRT